MVGGIVMVVTVSLGQLAFYLISVVVAGLIGYSIKGGEKHTHDRDANRAGNHYVNRTDI